MLGVNITHTKIKSQNWKHVWHWCHLCILFVENCGSLQHGFMSILITILFHDDFVHYGWNWDPCWSLQGCLPCSHWHKKWYNGTNIIQNILEKVHKAPGWYLMHPNIYHIWKLSHHVWVWQKCVRSALQVSSQSTTIIYLTNNVFYWPIDQIM